MKTRLFIASIVVISVTLTAWAKTKKAETSPVYNVLLQGTQSGNMLARAVAVSALVKFKKNKEVLKYVTDATHDPQWPVRKEAIIALYRLGKKAEALTALRKEMDDPTLSWERDFKDLIRAMNKRDALKFLKSVLNDPKIQIKKQILLSLLSAGGPWVKFVAKQVSSGMPDALDMARALDKTRAALLIPGLVKTRNPKIAGLVLDLAKKHGIKLSSKVLWRFAKIKDPGVRSRAALALAKLGDRKALNAVKGMANARGKNLSVFLHIASLVPNKKIIPMLKKRFLNDKTPTQDLVYVLTALAKFHDSAAGKFVAEGINSTDMNVRVASVRVLPLFQGAMAMKTLEKMVMEGNTQVKIAAARAMGDLARKDTVETLQRALNQAYEPKFKLILIHALARIKDVSIVDVLSYHVYDPNPEIKKAAILAIAGIKDAKAAKLLRAFMEDPDPAIRKAVLENIISVDPKAALENFERVADGLSVRDILDLASEFGKKFAPFVEKAINSTVPFIRNAAFQCLYVFPAKDRKALLEKLVSTSDFPDVRLHALLSAAKSGCKQACPLAMALIHDKDDNCRLAAIRIAGQCCGKGKKTGAKVKNLLLTMAKGPLDITAITAAATYATMPKRPPRSIPPHQVDRWLNH